MRFFPIPEWNALLMPKKDADLWLWFSWRDSSFLFLYSRVHKDINKQIRLCWKTLYPDRPSFYQSSLLLWYLVYVAQRLILFLHWAFYRLLNRILGQTIFLRWLSQWSFYLRNAPFSSLPAALGMLHSAQFLTQKTASVLFSLALRLFSWR